MAPRLLFCVEKAAAGKHSSAIPGSAGAGAHDAVAEGPKEFLKDYTQVLLTDVYGGYNGVAAGNSW